MRVSCDFFSALPKERLHPLTLAFIFSLLTYCDIPWKPFFLLSPSSEGRVWPRCVRLLPPQAIWLHHWLELDGGRAGNVISRQTLREKERVRGQEPRVLLSLCLHPWIFAMSKAIRAFSLLLPILYLLLSFSVSVSSSDGEYLHIWTVSTTLSCLWQQLTDCL